MSLILAGAPYSAAASGETLQSFTLENTAGSTTPVLARFGLPFKKGDMPSGSVPKIEVNGGSEVTSVQFDERTTWSDGSLKFCVCHMRDTSIGASSSRTYNVSAQSGSFNNTAWDTQANIISDITTNSDFTGTFSNHSQPNQSDTTNHVYSLNTALGTTTRLTIIHSGDVCYGGYVWEYKNSELTGMWYFDVWNDGGDTSNGNIEVQLKLGLTFWDVANKDRHDYDLTFKDDTTTLDTYTGIQHHYHGEWATHRTADDLQHGKRHWQTSSQMPTLNYKPDKAYWVTTGLVPPMDTSFTPDSNTSKGYTDTVDPMNSMAHRAAIDGTGPYMGRGLLPVADTTAFMTQNSTDVRICRANSYAGLHVGYHYRLKDNRNRSSKASDAYNDFSGESADIANCFIPLTLSPLETDATAYNADGLPDSGHYYKGSAGEGYTSYTGGTGEWSLSGHTSHAVNYSYFIYLLEGERIFHDATVSLAINGITQTNGNSYIGRSTLFFYGVTERRTSYSIPSTQYDGVALFNSSNNRAGGWLAMLLGSASAILPDNDVYRNFWNNLIEQNGNWITAGLSYIPTAQKNAGAVFQTNSSTTMYGSMWTDGGFIPMGLYHCYNCTEDTGFKSGADTQANVTTNAWSSWKYSTDLYRFMYHTKDADWDDSTNPYLTGGRIFGKHANNLTFAPGTSDTTINGSLSQNWDWDDDIKVTPLRYGTQGDTRAVLPNITQGTEYFTVNTTASSVQLATTSGGSAINLSGYGAINITGITQAADAVITSAGHPLVTGDKFTVSGVSGMTEINGGSYTVTSTTVDTITIGNNSSGWTAYTSGGTIDLIVELAVESTNMDESVMGTLGDAANADDYTPILHATLVMAHMNGQTNATQSLMDEADTFVSGLDQTGWSPWKYAEY